jgi:hypothetical protein
MQRNKRLYLGKAIFNNILLIIFVVFREHDINEKKEKLEKTNEINKGHQAKVMEILL